MNDESVKGGARDEREVGVPARSREETRRDNPRESRGCAEQAITFWRRWTACLSVTLRGPFRAYLPAPQQAESRDPFRAGPLSRVCEGCFQHSYMLRAGSESGFRGSMDPLQCRHLPRCSSEAAVRLRSLLRTSASTRRFSVLPLIVSKTSI